MSFTVWPLGQRRARAFTLIELLVVVGIIATLLSILLPSLSRARHHARGVMCLARCRELGHGMMLYHVENGNYPAHQWRLANNVRMRWFNVMGVYLGGAPKTGSFDPELAARENVQCCPSTPDWEVGRNNSYGYNYKYLGSARENTEPNNPHRPYETFPVRELRAPGKTIAFADCDGTGWEKPWGPEKTEDHPEADHDPLRFGNHGYTLDPTYIPLRSVHTLSGGKPEPYAWHNWRTYMSGRHLGKGNALLADGHGERIDPVVAYEDNALWNGLGWDPGPDPNAAAAGLDPHVDYKWDVSSGQQWRYPQ